MVWYLLEKNFHNFLSIEKPGGLEKSKSSRSSIIILLICLFILSVVKCLQKENNF